MFAGLPGEKGDRGLPGKYHNTTIVLSCVHSNFSFYKLFKLCGCYFNFFYSILYVSMHLQTKLMTQSASHIVFFFIYTYTYDHHNPKLNPYLFKISNLHN